MEIKYIIAERNGAYEAKFEASSRVVMLAEEIADRVGARVLYKGTFNDGKKTDVVLRAVEEANKSGKFDSKLLESRLSE